jgi:hypothetical protein
MMGGNEVASDLLGYRDIYNSDGKGQMAEKGRRMARWKFLANLLSLTTVS